MSISIPIEASDREQAYQFAEQQPTQVKAAQVYHNTLAVLVMQRYLQRLGVETTLATSHSWHPLERLLENVADLYIPGLLGMLECRPVQQGDLKCIVPPEVWEDRLGYVVVQLDPPYQAGHLLGFVKTVSVPELPLSYLQPLDELIGLLLERSPEPLEPVVALRQWLKQVFEPSWQPPTDLLSRMETIVLLASPLASPLANRGAPQGDFLRKRLEALYRQQSTPRVEDAQLSPANTSDEDVLVNLIQATQNDDIRWQSAELLWELNPRHPACPVMTAKDLGLYLTGHRIALAVGILPKPDGSLLMLTRVYPLGDLPHLPKGLMLRGLDEAGHVFFEVEARSQDNYIQFKFTAGEGDRFSIHITLGTASFVESFAV